MTKETNPPTVTVDAKVFDLLLNACMALADHEGDRIDQVDLFALRDKAGLAVNAAIITKRRP